MLGGVRSTMTIARKWAFPPPVYWEVLGHLYGGDAGNPYLTNLAKLHHGRIALAWRQYSASAE